MFPPLVLRNAGRGMEPWTGLKSSIFSTLEMETRQRCCAFLPEGNGKEKKLMSDDSPT